MNPPPSDFVPPLRRYGTVGLVRRIGAIAGGLVGLVAIVSAASGASTVTAAVTGVLLGVVLITLSLRWPK